MKHEIKNGFTIIEMIVAVGVFAVVMTVSATAFLGISEIQRKTEALRTINDNLNFSLELMMREIRGGYGYSVGGGGTSFSFSTGTSTSLNNINYRLSSGRIEKSVNSGSWVGVTAPEINITGLVFKVVGQVSGDKIQPRVTIIITGLAGDKNPSKLNLQTTISQRKIDS